MFKIFMGIWNGFSIGLFNSFFIFLRIYIMCENQKIIIIITMIIAANTGQWERDVSTRRHFSITLSVKNRRTEK